MTCREICTAIFRARQNSGYTDKEFAERAGIGINTFRHYADSENIRLDVLLRMAETLGLEVKIVEK